MTIEPNNAKNQDIIFSVCKKHNIKSLQLTSLHIQLMDDCIEEYKSQPAPVQEGKTKEEILDDLFINYTGFNTEHGNLNAHQIRIVHTAMENYRNQSTGLREGEWKDELWNLIGNWGQAPLKNATEYGDRIEKYIESLINHSTPLQPSGGREGLWDLHSRAIPEDDYDGAEGIAKLVAGKSIMFKEDFLAAIQSAIPSEGG